MYKPRTKSELWAFISHRFGLKLPHKSFTPGHSTPFGFVADAFFNPSGHLAAWANRSGLKTLCASVIAALEFCFGDTPLNGRVLAGSEDQATNLYGYWREWCYGVLAGRLGGEPGKLLTKLDNGTFSILAASQKRVRGGKVQRLFRDEIDEIAPEIYAASVGMLATRPGAPARTIDTSTWHRPHGPMGRLVAEADKRRITLHKWAIWESIERCPAERHDGGRNCPGCPLGEVCLAKARELDPRATIGQAARCCGLFPIDDAITYLSQWSRQQWQAEAECRRPSLEGLVYPQFDRAVHVMADLDFADALPIYRAIDFGLNDFVCLWLQVDKAACVYVVDEYWANQATLARNARDIRKLDKNASIEATFVDPAGRNRNDQTGFSATQVLKAEGIPCAYSLSSWAREVANGINLIRAALEPAAGRPRLFVAGKCEKLIEAFESYKLRQVNGEYVDEPIKPQACDHPLDALRYFFVNRFARRGGGARQLGFT